MNAVRYKINCIKISNFFFYLFIDNVITVNYSLHTKMANLKNRAMF